MSLATFIAKKPPRANRFDCCCRRLRWMAAMVVVSLSLLQSSIVAAADPPIPSSVQVNQAESLESLQQEYSRLVEELRSSLKGIGTSSRSFGGRGSDEAEHWRAEWEKSVATGESTLEPLKKTALELFRRQPEPSDDVIDLALQISLNDLSDERYEAAAEILERAIQLGRSGQVEDFLARVQLLTNKFAAAHSYFKDRNSLVLKLPKLEQSLYRSIDELMQQAAHEEKLQEQEAVADDLPRVEFLTSTGKFVVELFENEAPATVANFISLVENGYYNGVIFHNVKRQTVAQAGGFGVVQANGMNTLQPRGVRYRIFDEYDRDDARHHFRGSLSMANQNSPNTGSSQFFICLSPLPMLNGNHTVFGRVIDGMSAVADLEITMQEDDKGKEEPIKEAIPSLILSSRVIRKRSHEYKPEPVSIATQKQTDSTPNLTRAPPDGGASSVP